MDWSLIAFGAGTFLGGCAFGFAICNTLWLREKERAEAEENNLPTGVIMRNCEGSVVYGNRTIIVRPVACSARLDVVDHDVA